MTACSPLQDVDFPMKVGGGVTGVTVDPSKSSRLTVTLAGIWGRVMGSVSGVMGPGPSREAGVRRDWVGCVECADSVSDGMLAAWCDIKET